MNIPTPFPEDGEHLRIEPFKPGKGKPVRAAAARPDGSDGRVGLPDASLEDFLERIGPPAEDTRKPVEFKTLSAFIKEYVPLDYIVDPIIRGGALYTLTAKTGTGKTALMVTTALAVATGRRDLLDLDVATRRVAYLTAENPDDARMRFMIACFLLNVDFAEIADRIVILDRRERPEDIGAALAKLAEPFALVLVDTLAAFFDGTDINAAVEGGDFFAPASPAHAHQRIAGRRRRCASGQERGPEQPRSVRLRRDP